MSILDTYNHIQGDWEQPCWHCGEPTKWLELSFEVALHPGPCTNAKWRQFVASLPEDERRLVLEDET